VKNESSYARASGLRQRATRVFGNDVDDLTYSCDDVSLDVCKLAHALLRDKGIRVKRMWRIWWRLQGRHKVAQNHDLAVNMCCCVLWWIDPMGESKMAWGTTTRPTCNH
jgi:hypothetical protein